MGNKLAQPDTYNIFIDVTERDKMAYKWGYRLK